MSATTLGPVDGSYPGGALIAAKKEIRVLWVLPGQDEENVSCELETVSLMARPRYTAFSYVWGDQTHVRHISLNGQSFAVTEHLEDALHTLRLTDTRKCFWIDQLCIDQRSIEDRNRQVNLMGEIYASASEVFVWLDEIAESVLTELGHDKDDPKSRKFTAETAVDIVNRMKMLNTEECVEVDIVSVDKALVALNIVLSCSW